MLGSTRSIVKSDSKTDLQFQTVCLSVCRGCNEACLQKPSLSSFYFSCYRFHTKTPLKILCTAITLKNVLEGFQIETLLTGGIAACFQRCLRNFQCESVNYDNSERPLGTCELNEKKPSELHQLIYRPGYIFVQAVIKELVSPMFVAKNAFSKYHFKRSTKDKAQFQSTFVYHFQ